MLFDADSVLDVADDLVAALGGRAWLQSSTVGPDGMARIAAAVPSAAGRLLDAPVLGTRKPAEDGTLLVLLSGPAPRGHGWRPAWRRSVRGHWSSATTWGRRAR